ncbi:auxin-responsive protein IAA9-like isoform X2 [Vitis riparia]|uniref:auxin-responsive protein IAA9-like isoform X2 n=1 Tax=Vitis riparia TaxID=96939 RepID=UPI00155AC2C2|nr:auxin-responsive protein IAA9-like isoform X2 [Vitis riparia]
MELQLGLALPTSPVNDFDLNCHVSDPTEAASSDLCGRGDDMISGRSNKKRGFIEAFELPPQTLPLLLWNDHPNDDDDDDDRQGVENSSFIAKKKKICSDNRDDNDRTVLQNGSARAGVGGGVKPNSKYVKVKMVGVGIARKIDLSRHHSYQTLTNTLINMFGKCQQDAQSFKLAYQDREGDWLLAGDVPWRTFIQSVERLKILRIGG